MPMDLYLLLDITALYRSISMIEGLTFVSAYTVWDFVANSGQCGLQSSLTLNLSLTCYVI